MRVLRGGLLIVVLGFFSLMFVVTLWATESGYFSKELPHNKNKTSIDDMHSKKKYISDNKAYHSILYNITRNVSDEGLSSMSFITYSKRSIQQPSKHIKCFQDLSASFLSQLLRHREKIIKENVLLKPFSTKPLPRMVHNIQATDFEYFEKLKPYQDISTIFFNASRKDIESCLLKEYYPVYVIHNCNRVLSIAKRHEQYGKPLYSMVCDSKLEKTLLPSLLLESNFIIGLPRDYSQGIDMKTVSYINVIRHAIVSTYGDVYIRGVTVTPQRCYPENQVRLSEKDQALLPVVDEVFTIAQFFGSGMFHGNVEVVSRIVLYISFLEKNPNVLIHVTDKIPLFMSMFGFDESRFLTSTVKAKIVYMPAGTGCCLPNLITTQLQSFYLRQSLPNLWNHRDLIILVKRSKRKNRYFHYQNDIRSMLESVSAQYGLKVWEFGDNPVPPLTKAAMMFNNAVMVVAPHGAGEINLLFSQPGIVLIESLCFDTDDGKVNLVYRNIVHVIGGHYYGFYKKGKHCTYTTAEDLRKPVLFYLDVIRKTVK